MVKYRRIIYYFIPALILLTMTGYFVRKPERAVFDQHNCRFWGIIFSDMSTSLADTIRNHLDSLKALSISNQDGWGFGYFMEIENQEDPLGIIMRGEPMAQNDPRYVQSIEEMIKYTEHCGITHIRSGSSGPTGGIPDPHPFLRKSLYREFEMILAHNGNIPVKQLLALIRTINPLYIELNPPDYDPDYVDSDLYAILIIEIIDTYLSLTIEECIQLAITKIDSAVGLSAAKYNFVMSDGKKIWALNYNKSPLERASLYIYPNVSLSSFWIAASVPLDTFDIFWAAVPNSTLVVLNPHEPPDFIRIFNTQPPSSTLPILNIIYPNPFKGEVNIRYCLEQGSRISFLKIFDINGRLIRKFELPASQSLVPTTISWDGTDNFQREVPGGVYYCVLNTSGENYTRKIVLVR